MTAYLGLITSLVSSTVALGIAIVGWRRSDQRATKDKLTAEARHRAELLAQLLELHLEAEPAGPLTIHPAATKNDVKMKAILLQLPGHLATVLRVRLRLEHTMKGVRLDRATAARLRSNDKHDAGHKWLIFDRNSVLINRGFLPYGEWVETELVYDIAGELHGDQDAVLQALSKDVRDPKDAEVAGLRDAKEQRELEAGDQKDAAS
ncbi:MAG: hypothetical protein WBA97_12095 [Actinophytocola sp.]|uniref:hypothetical protein n=1 Tax=Actinophytocola sp. TaxID=1872138 RepID=UPI003C7107FC